MSDDQPDYKALAREAEMGYTGQPPRMIAVQNILLNTTDARTWAYWFKNQFGDVAPDRATMTTWFASAIEVGRNAGMARRREPVDRAWLEEARASGEITEEQYQGWLE
jgi:hypothetical protein